MSTLIPDSLARVEINAEDLAHNFRHLTELAGGATEVAAIVKSDAYGHGLLLSSRAFHEAGCRVFCVASTEEAVFLREHLGPDIRILKMVPSLPEEYEAVATNGIEQALASEEDRRGWQSWLSERGLKLSVHLKVDRGMGRLGFSYPDFMREAEEIAKSPIFNWVGLMSHLPASEESPDPSAVSVDRNDYTTTREVNRFRLLAKEVESLFGRPLVKHIGNSGALLFHPESRFDLVRCGLALYGADPRGQAGTGLGLRPAMAVRSGLVQIRALDKGATVGYGRDYRVRQPTRVGVAAVGYADGFFRRLAEYGCVLVRGQRCGILGRISMNLISVDLSDVEGARMGDTVTLLGADGDERISVEELARWAGTIPYEVFTSLGGLIRRRVAI
ncbi:MAG: alanine racemase [Candidatus Omnitrophica bacterium]|nr:Alanine racemase 1 [bacterium]NUN97152.1 alanine racemase [Candidatus Omnitrophota bacterium]